MHIAEFVGTIENDDTIDYDTRQLRKVSSSISEASTKLHHIKRVVESWMSYKQASEGVGSATAYGSAYELQNPHNGLLYSEVNNMVLMQRDWVWALSNLRKHGFKVKTTTNGGGTPVSHVYKPHLVLHKGKVVQTGAYVLWADKKGDFRGNQAVRNTLSQRQIEEASTLSIYIAHVWKQNSTDTKATIERVEKIIREKSLASDSDFSLHHDEFLHTGRHGYTLNVYACTVHEPGDPYIVNSKHKPCYVGFSFRKLYHIYPTLNIIDWVKGNWWPILMVQSKNPMHEVVAYQLPCDKNIPENTCSRVYSDTINKQDLKQRQYVDPDEESEEYAMCPKVNLAFSVVQELFHSVADFLIPRAMNFDGEPRVHFFVGAAGTGKSAFFDMITSLVTSARVHFGSAKGGSSSNTFGLAAARKAETRIIAYDEMDSVSAGINPSDVLLIGTNSSALVTNAKNGQIQSGEVNAYIVLMGNDYADSLTGVHKEASEEQARSNDAIARRARGYHTHRKPTVLAKKALFSSFTSRHNRRHVEEHKEDEEDNAVLCELEAEEPSESDNDDDDDDVYENNDEEDDEEEDLKPHMDGDAVALFRDHDEHPAFAMMALAISKFSFPISTNFQSDVSGWKNRSRDVIAQKLFRGTRGGAFVDSSLYVRQGAGFVMPYALLGQMFDHWAVRFRKKGNKRLHWDNSVWNEIRQATGCRLVYLCDQHVEEIRSEMKRLTRHTYRTIAEKSNKDSVSGEEKNMKLMYEQFEAKNASHLAKISGKSSQLLNCIRYPPLQCATINLNEVSSESMAATNQQPRTETSYENEDLKHTFEENTGSTAAGRAIYVVGLQPLWTALQQAGVVSTEHAFSTRVDKQFRHFDWKANAWEMALVASDSYGSLKTSFEEGIITAQERLNMELLRLIGRYSSSSDAKGKNRGGKILDMRRKYDVLKQPIFSNFKEEYLINTAYVPTSMWPVPVVQYSKNSAGELNYVDPMITPATKAGAGYEMPPFYDILESRLVPFVYFDAVNEVLYRKFTDTGERTSQYDSFCKQHQTISNPNARDRKAERAEAYYKQIYRKYRMLLHRYARCLHLRCLHDIKTVENESTENDAVDGNDDDKLKIMKLALTRYRALDKALQWETST